MHEHTDRFIKYIWSVFFFVLTVNILGLLPIPAVSGLLGTHLGGTATGNIWMTATLAIVTMALAALVRLDVRSVALAAAGGRSATAPARDAAPLVLTGRVTDPVHHPLRPRAPGMA